MESVTKEKKVASDRIDILIAFATQTSKPWLCVEVVSALRELQELRRDVARYENGRVVLLAELNAAKQFEIERLNQLLDCKSSVAYEDAQDRAAPAPPAPAANEQCSHKDKVAGLADRFVQWKGYECPYCEIDRLQRELAHWKDCHDVTADALGAAWLKLAATVQPLVEAKRLLRECVDEIDFDEAGQPMLCDEIVEFLEPSTEHPCAHLGCPSLIGRGAVYCSEHEPLYRDTLPPVVQLAPDEVVFWQCADKECNRFCRQFETLCWGCKKPRAETPPAGEKDG